MSSFLEVGIKVQTTQSEMSQCIIFCRPSKNLLGHAFYKETTFEWLYSRSKSTIFCSALIYKALKLKRELKRNNVIMGVEQ